MIKWSSIQKRVILAIGQAGLANAPTPVSATVVVGASTANTRLAVPHGLGFAPELHSIMVVPVGLDDDVVQPSFAVVKADSTNITVKPTTTQAATAVQFLVIIFLDSAAPPIVSA